MTYDTINDAQTLRSDLGSLLGCIDQYELLRELGGGGFGSVYLARDTVAGIEVAVKGLPPVIRNNAEELERIRENFALVSRLHHPYIAAALHLHRAQDVRYSDESVREKLRVLAGDTLMVMEYAPGVTLSKWRKQFPGGKVPLEQAIQLVWQVAQALDYAHEQHIIHRDIKPSNIIVETNPDGEVVARLLDFGLAAEIRSSMGRVSREIRDTSGTRPYMAPEQWAGRKQGPATDQYALAVLLCELLTGEVPFASVFETGDPVIMMTAICNRDVELPDGCPRQLALRRALAKEPSQRFGSCMEFVETAAKSEARSHATPLQADRTHIGHGNVVKLISPGLLLGLSALSALVLVGGILWSIQRQRQREKARVQARIVAAQQAEEEARKAEEAERKKAEESAKRQSALDKAKRKADSVAQQQPDDAEQKSKTAQAHAAKLVRLKTRINIKVSDAKDKMERINAFRADSDGFGTHIASADAQWKTIAAIGVPNGLEDARKTFDVVDNAEGQISLDLDWLLRNKAGRDAAKTAETEIATLLAGDIATFEAERYAAKAVKDGKDLHAKGKEAFGKGDFTEAGRILSSARTQFVAAAKEAKGFYIVTTLEAAREYLKAEKWQECIDEVDKVIRWDDGNVEAKRLKTEAESHFMPSLTINATVDGRVAAGAKITIDGMECKLPVERKTLEYGERFGPCRVSYESGGKRYYGTFDALTVGWRGPKEVTVDLKEYIEPKLGDTQTITLPGGATMTMIYVAPGSFMMGSNKGFDDEKPVHKVTLTRGFWMGKYEVTQAQWKCVMGDNPSFFEGDDRPVECVDWDDCQRFIKAVNERLGDGMVRLPTEAEWEYACRAGTTGDFGGTGKLDVKGWYCGNSRDNGTHPVGQKLANAWGFHDMHGNVWEWCSDWYGSYSMRAVVDPTGPSSGSVRVWRGGSWDNFANRCTSSVRNHELPSNSFAYGFRLVKTLSD